MNFLEHVKQKPIEGIRANCIKNREWQSARVMEKQFDLMVKIGKEIEGEFGKDVFNKQNESGLSQEVGKYAAKQFLEIAKKSQTESTKSIKKTRNSNSYEKESAIAHFCLDEFERRVLLERNSFLLHSGFLDEIPLKEFEKYFDASPEEYKEARLMYGMAPIKISDEAMNLGLALEEKWIQANPSPKTSNGWTYEDVNAENRVCMRIPACVRDENGRFSVEVEEKFTVTDSFISFWKVASRLIDEELYTKFLDAISWLCVRNVPWAWPKCAAYSMERHERRGFRLELNLDSLFERSGYVLVTFSSFGRVGSGSLPQLNRNETIFYKPKPDFDSDFELVKRVQKVKSLRPINEDYKMWKNAFLGEMED